MPPKKVHEPEKKPLIGRVGTNLKVGIVGVPNVGKSTFFNVLTKSSAAAENFPFCTIDPNENKRGELIYSHTHGFHHRGHLFDTMSDSVVSAPVIGADYLDQRYAFANSYYPYTEDVDPVERVNHLLVAPPSFTSLSSLDSRSFVQEKTYSTRSAQIRYLESNPASFIILGKPGIGEKELGKYLANHWKCVYIEPQLLIEQEINSGSRAGQCIEFNLRCGRAIGIDVILRLVEKRVHSESAKHRGFVICGLPLIPNDLYTEDPVSSESAVFNVREIFDEVLETVVELGVPPPSKPHVSIASKYDSVEGEGAEKKEAVEGEEAGEGGMHGEGSQTFPDILPMLNREPSIPIDIGADYDICQPPEIGTNYEDQLAFIFNLIRDPFLIIYIACSTTDVLEKRDHYRFDIYTQEKVSLFREKYDNLIYKYFSKEKGLSADEIPEELFDIPFPDDHSLHKHLVKLPRHFKANVSTQLDSFHYTGLRFIEQRVLSHDPQYYVKVDGRTSVQRMFNIVKTKMKTLPLQSVALPEKLAVAESQVDVGEGGPPVSPQNMTLEEAYREFCRRQTPSTIFKWTWSDWGTKCPVSMKDGVYRDGSHEYAVHFMNNIFFLADQDAHIKFFRNPRPYLLPPFPKPTCKFFIFGPNCSGKSAIANCLAFNFSGTVLSFNEMIRNLISQKLESIKEKIRQAAIAEAMKLLDEMRATEAEELEKQRIEDIKEWVNTISADLEQLADYIDGRHKEEDTKQFEISSFPMAMQKKAMAEMETESAIAIRFLHDKFEELDIPVPSSTDKIRIFAQEKKKLLQYIPNHLKHKVKPKPASVYDDFVIEYAEKAVANAHIDVGMANENFLEMFIEGIRKVEENSLAMGNCKGGWILDGMVCDPELLESLYPDYVADEIIVLLDEEGDEFLIDRYKERGLNHFSNYRQFFMDLGRVDAAWRAPTEVLPKPFPEAMVRDILSEIFDDSSKFRGMTDKDLTYRRQLESFREKWEEVKSYFVNRGVEPIEIKVTNKSISDLMKETLRVVEDRYRVKAALYTEEDRAEEVRNFGVQVVQEEGMTEGPLPPVTDAEDPIEKNRRYGDTYNFCPVTFAESWVLWKGKEEFAVKFEDKVYLFANQENRDRFLIEPRKFLTGNPPESIPPPRVCIVGMPGSKKTDLGIAVAHNYGLMFLSYEELIKNALGISSSDHFDKLRQNERIDPVLRDYLNTGSALPENIYSEVLYKLWFADPTKKLGFILDDFPKRPVDVQFMIKYRLIPDVVICLISDDVALKASLLGDLTESWQARAETRRTVIEEDNKHAVEEWEKKRQQRFKELLNERREKRYLEKRQELLGEGDESSPGDTSDTTDLKAVSQVSFDSVADQRDIDEINGMLDVELPELQLEKLPEVNEEVILQFEAEISNMIAIENEAVRNVAEMCKPEMIEVVPVPMDFDLFVRNYRKVLFVVDKVKYRSPAVFERCYEVSMEVADRLLSCGYYFLSKFGKTCPVQYAEDKIPFQMFLPMEQRYNVFPVIHRNYIYFIVGKEAVEKFRTNPLKYIMVDSVRFPLIPFNVAVSGPPKCGKTILADRIRNTYGMKLISRGQAIRYVLSYMPFCQLAINMEEVLRKGWEVTDEMVARCVEAASMDPRAVTQASRVPVPDERFDYLCEYFKPLSKVPAFLNVVDIAGLVKGASEGQGLGNAFLSHISGCDAIFHLCRAFEDDDVTHVEGEVNPVRDLDIISEELRLKDEDTLTKNLEKLERTVGRGADKKLKPEYDTLVKIKSVLVDEKKHIRFGDWDAKDIEVLNKYLFLTSKPALYLVNLSEKDYIKKKNKWLVKIKEWVDKNDPGANIIPFSGAFEQKLVEEYSDPALRKKYLEELNTTSALDKIIVQGYRALQLEYFFTAGPDEVKAWTIQKGTKAPQAAGKIHTDFEKGFIMAEVMKFNDFKEEGSEAAAKAAGKYRQQGRNYVVEDGDIIFFKFNAGAGLQQAKKK